MNMKSSSTWKRGGLKAMENKSCSGRKEIIFPHKRELGTRKRV